MGDGDQQVGPLRVAIVGVGPKGLFALERLLDHAHRSGRAAGLDIDLFEPHPAPGAGPVYDPAQPAYLRMNFAADRLDMWYAHSRAVGAGERRSFLQWRRDAGDGGDVDECYPPRALVGRYLADGLTRMRRAAPRGVTIALRPTAAHAVRRTGSTWQVVAADTIREYDEVLLTVGHTTEPDRWATDQCDHAAPLVPAVFPVTRWLSPTRVAPGATVAIRGFALTFIDAAIALTEGRGGVFEADDHPYRLRYTPSGREAGLLVPFSRTGRPMLAKPGPPRAAHADALEAISRAGRGRILDLPDGFAVDGDLLAILASTAGASLLAAGGRRCGGERLRRARSAARTWLGAVTAGESPRAPHGPAEEVERSLAVGAGLRPPDLQWALGHSWRTLYPALVERLSADGLVDRQWPAFVRLAAQMERVSFGPPACNAAKLLALVAAGRVDLRHVTAGRIVTRDRVTSICSAGGERAVDVVVNAVLPGPGALRSDAGLLERIVADGHARIVSGRRGLEVALDAGCVGRDGARTPGLSALGRPTEDCVIGNDTLSRTLHPHADHWARRIALRSEQQPAPSEPSPPLLRGAA